MILFTTFVCVFFSIATHIVIAFKDELVVNGIYETRLLQVGPESRISPTSAPAPPSPPAFSPCPPAPADTPPPPPLSTLTPDHPPPPSYSRLEALCALSPARSDVLDDEDLLELLGDELLQQQQRTASAPPQPQQARFAVPAELADLPIAAFLNLSGRRKQQISALRERLEGASAVVGAPEAPKRLTPTRRARPQPPPKRSPPKAPLAPRPERLLHCISPIDGARIVIRLLE